VSPKDFYAELGGWSDPVPANKTIVCERVVVGSLEVMPGIFFPTLQVAGRRPTKANEADEVAILLDTPHHLAALICALEYLVADNGLIAEVDQKKAEIRDFMEPQR